MTINHIGHTFESNFNPPWWEFFYLTIGKLTFPIMAYLLVQGLTHTKSFSKYVIRLVFYGILSILPYHYVLTNTEHIYVLNNIMFTLATGLIMIKLMQLNEASHQERSPSLDALYLLSAMLITSMSDWNIIGVLLIWLFYKYKDQYSTPLVIFTILLTLIECLGTSDFMSLNYLGILLTIPLLHHYNKKRGFSNTVIKYGFYLYYPLHLTLLWFISSYLIR